MQPARLPVGIVGASGYTGEELVRLLARHPRVRLAAVCSRTLAGKAVADEMPRLRGVVDPALAFAASDPAACAASEVDVWFLALPHGVAAEYARPLVAAGKRVLDLSADFRLSDPALYRTYYGHEHPAPELLAQARYVIPELEPGDGWKAAPLVACPGCYPTSILLPLIPLLRAGLVRPAGIIADSMSGVTGAGRKAELDYLFCECNESLRAYGVPKHRHLSEIEEQLSIAAGSPVVIQFTPHLVPVNRGIHTTLYVAPTRHFNTPEAAAELAQQQGVPSAGVRSRLMGWFSGGADGLRQAWPVRVRPGLGSGGSSTASTSRDPVRPPPRSSPRPAWSRRGSPRWPGRSRSRS